MMTSIDAADSPQASAQVQAKATPQQRLIKAQEGAAAKARVAKQKADEAELKKTAQAQKAAATAQAQAEKAQLAVQTAEAAVRRAALKQEAVRLKAAAAAEKARKKAEADAEKARKKAEADLEKRRKAEAAAEKARKKSEADAEKTRKKAEADAEKKRKADAAAELARRAESDEFLIERLTLVRSAENQLAALSEMSKTLSKVEKQGFLEKWSREDLAQLLPSQVGSLLVQSGKAVVRKFFLMSDVVAGAAVNGAQPAGAPQTSAMATDAASSVSDRLLKAFERMEQSGGGYYVTLHDLRLALPDVRRDDFDEALHELRRAWILTLNPAEGRHETVPKEVLDAGIMEESRMLVYVARRES